MFLSRVASPITESHHLFLVCHPLRELLPHSSALCSPQSLTSQVQMCCWVSCSLRLEPVFPGLLGGWEHGR